MKILITGANGVVGRYIASQLTDHELLTPSSSELDLRELAAVTDWFRNNKVDSVVHCALSGRECLGSLDPKYLSDGLLMFRNLWLQRKLYNKFINLGTAYEFNLDEDNTDVRESEIVYHLPSTSYGYSKNLIARIIRETNRFYNLRLFGVFHENENEQRFFKRVAAGDHVVINNNQLLDYIYLPDIMPMINCILAGLAQHQDINMVYPNKYRLSELAYYLCEQLDIDKSNIKIADYNGCNLTGDSLRLASYNFPLIGIKQGLRNYK